MEGGYLIDFLALALYFGTVLGVGWRSSRGGDGSSKEFSLGGRRMPWWAITASIIASELSAATFLGTPGEGFADRNFFYAQLAIGTILARVIVAYLFIRAYYDFNVISIYELMEKRFGPVSKNAASAVFLLTRLLASGTRLYAPSIILVLAVEVWLPPSPGLELGLYAVCILGITVLTTIYTALGGIKAVVWTDLIQAGVMVGAVTYTVISLLLRVGGWSGVMHAMNGPNDLAFFNTGTDPKLGLLENVRAVLGSEFTIYSALLGSTFVTMATHGTDQDMVQRMLTAPNYHRSRLALIASGLADLPITLGFLSIGLLLATYYQANPNQAVADHPNNVFAYYIIHEMPPGARGLVIAGLMATAMGSLSTALNALATSFTEDFWRPYLSKDPKAEVEVNVVRWATVVFAVLLVLVGVCTAYVVLQSPNKARILPVVLGSFGYTYGCLLGIFLLAVLTKTRGSEVGNVIAMLCGFICVALLSGLPWDLWNIVRGHSLHVSWDVIFAIQNGVASLKDGYLAPPSWLWQVEFPWRIFFGTITTFLVAICFPSDKKAHAS